MLKPVKTMVAGALCALVLSVAAASQTHAQTERMLALRAGEIEDYRIYSSLDYPVETGRWARLV